MAARKQTVRTMRLLWQTLIEAKVAVHKVAVHVVQIEGLEIAVARCLEQKLKKISLVLGY